MDAWEFLNVVKTECDNKDFSAGIIEQILGILKIKISCHNINLIHERESTDHVNFLLSANRNFSNYSIKLARQSNGLVYQIYKSQPQSKCCCRLLAIPSDDFNNKFSKTDIEHLLKNNEYNIYNLNDGTTISIYYDPSQGVWLFASKNSCNFGDLTWRGYKCSDIIRDTLKQYNFSFDKLDKNCCYSIGFKHPAFHQFRQPGVWTWNSEASSSSSSSSSASMTSEWIKKAWFISGYNLEAHRPLTQQEISVLQIPEQKILPLMTLKGSKSIFSDIVAQCGCANRNFVKTGKAFLGYILRAKDETEASEFTNIKFESSLYVDIKMCIYNKYNSRDKILRQKTKETFKHLENVVLEAYLNFYKRIMFVKLFPQFAPKFDEFDVIFQDAINIIYNAKQNEPLPQTYVPKHAIIKNTEPKLPSIVESKSMEPKIEPKIELKVKSKQEAIAEYFIPLLKSCFRPCNIPARSEYLRQSNGVSYYRDVKQSNIDKKIIRDLIRKPEYLNVYSKILFPELHKNDTDTKL